MCLIRMNFTGSYTVHFVVEEQINFTRCHDMIKVVLLIVTKKYFLRWKIIIARLELMNSSHWMPAFLKCRILRFSNRSVMLQ